MALWFTVAGLVVDIVVADLVVADLVVAVAGLAVVRDVDDEVRALVEPGAVIPAAPVAL